MAKHIQNDHSGTGAPPVNAPVSWQDIQQNTFTRWCNDELKHRGLKINDFKNDWKDGLLLVNLMEIISGQSLGRHNKHPKIPQQKLENLNIALNFIKSQGIKLVNVGSDDIHDGNIRIILGLLWTLILRYEIKRGSLNNVDDTGAADDLLRWVQSKIPEYNIKNWTSDWNDGRAVCALVDAVRPGHFPDHKSLTPADALNNATRGIDAAEKIGVDKLIYPQEMIHPKVDKLAMMTYIAQFRNLPDIAANASRCRAYGPGLVEGVSNHDAPFTVEVPADVHGDLQVKVVGPHSEAKVNIEQKDGIYKVSYHPTEAGTYYVHVTLDGVHIPGSVFKVLVLASESLGGEGKIRVFYSTTSHNQKMRSDFAALQRLFETKKIHLRPDFDPWIPVDVMEKNDREAVFRKAGTRDLPIVFIDDVYRGSYDVMLALEEAGQLDEALKMSQVSHYITEEEHLARLKLVSADSKDQTN